VASRSSVPLIVYREPLAPSGATFVTRRVSRWTGDFLFACLRGEQLRGVSSHGGRVVADRPLCTIATDACAPSWGARTATSAR
jgi:hypothetical protein